MRLDHVSYAAGPEGLTATAQRLSAQLGTVIRPGGVHPRFGTTNAILPLQGGTYLEVVGVLDHPAADKAPFGQAVRQRMTEGGGWLGWVVAVPDIAPVEQRLGREAVDGMRHRPDGYELRWRQIGVKGLLNDRALPFFVEWQVDALHHPSADATDVSISRIDMAGDPHAVSEWLGEPEDHPLDDIDVTWVEGDEPGIVAVEFATPAGLVCI